MMLCTLHDAYATDVMPLGTSTLQEDAGCRDTREWHGWKSHGTCWQVHFQPCESSNSQAEALAHTGPLSLLVKQQGAVAAQNALWVLQSGENCATMQLAGLSSAALGVNQGHCTSSSASCEVSVRFIRIAGLLLLAHLGVCKKGVDAMDGKRLDAETPCGNNCHPTSHGFQDWHSPGFITGCEQEDIVTTIQPR